MKFIHGGNRRRLAVLSAGAAVTAIAAVGAAGGSAEPAQRVVTASKVTISISLPLYHGKVQSDFDECAQHRRVTLYRVRPGDDKVLGKDRTNSQRRWRVNPGNVAPGQKFYAKVRNVEVSSVGTGLSCVKDRSRTVTFVGG